MPPMLSNRARALSPSPTVAIDGKAKQMMEQGIDVVNFSVGEPDFDTPADPKRGGIQAIESGFTKYTAVAGITPLRQAIVRKLKADNGLDYSPEQIVVSTGGKQALFNAFWVTVNPGDEVIIGAPYWVSYTEMVKMCEGVPVVIPTDEATGFKMTADMIRAQITPRTKIINLNSPSNPTGAVYTRDELRAIADLAAERGILIFTDEMYEKLLYDGAEHHSIAAFGPEIKKLTFTFNGFSKAYAMTGWRLGYVACEPEYAKAMAALQSQTTSAPSSISQKAALAALEGDQAPVEAMRQEFDRRRRYVVDRLNSMPGFRVDVMPEGAFYVFPRVRDLYGRRVRGQEIRNDDDLAMLLLQEAHVALVPGSGFGAPGYVRMSYATSMERLQTGLDRIEALLQAGG